MKENFHHLQNVLTIHSIYINFCALTLSNRTSNIKFVYNSCPRYVAKFIYQFTVTEKINIQVPKLNTYPHLPLMFSWKDRSWIILEILCRLSWTFKNELLFVVIVVVVVVVVVLGLFWKFSAPSLDIQEWAPVICISLRYFVEFFGLVAASFPGRSRMSSCKKKISSTPPWGKYETLFYFR